MCKKIFFSVVCMVIVIPCCISCLSADITKLFDQDTEEDTITPESKTVDEISPGEPAAEPCSTKLSAAEVKLYDFIMEYRRLKKLPSIPVSPSLSFVAQTHVRDLDAHPPKGDCNLHSWSNDGAWRSCCYTPDHKKAACMWNKPGELTSYKGNGYEISSWYSDMITPEIAFSGWKNSSGHNAVMVNLGIWSDITWKAIGIGIYHSYAVVWFGEEIDPCK